MSAARLCGAAPQAFYGAYISELLGMYPIVGYAEPPPSILWAYIFELLTEWFFVKDVASIRNSL